MQMNSTYYNQNDTSMSRKNRRLEKKQKKQRTKVKYKKYEEPSDEIITYQDVINSIVQLENVEREIYRETED